MEITISGLHKKTRCDRMAILRWFAEHGLEPVRVDGRTRYYDEAAAMEILAPKVEKHAQKRSEPNIDPETGLTWAQRKTKEEALEKARENELADKQKAGEWMSVKTHHHILGALVSRLETLPGKWRSELALTDRQATAIQRALDEAREQAAKEVENG